MNNHFFQNKRVCFWLEGCVHCRKVLPIVEQFNLKLPHHKKIKTVNCSMFQFYNILNDPLIALYQKSFDSYPTTFIGNIKISGANSKEEYIEALKEALRDDLIVAEHSEHRFNKSCEFKTKGLIRNVVICN